MLAKDKIMTRSKVRRSRNKLKAGSKKSKARTPKRATSMAVPIAAAGVLGLGTVAWFTRMNMARRLIQDKVLIELNQLTELQSLTEFHLFTFKLYLDVLLFLNLNTTIITDSLMKSFESAHQNVKMFDLITKMYVLNNIKAFVEARKQNCMQTSTTIDSKIVEHINCIYNELCYFYKNPTILNFKMQQWRLDNGVSTEISTYIEYIFNLLVARVSRNKTVWPSFSGTT